MVVVGVLPCALVAMWNTGYHANLAIEQLGLAAPTDWRGMLMGGLGIGHDPSSLGAATFYGLLYFLPIYAVTLLAWRVLGDPVCGNPQPRDQRRLLRHLDPLCPDASGDDPALAGRARHFVWRRHGQRGLRGHGQELHEPSAGRPAFLYFAYPVEMSGESVWTPPVDVVTGATPLAVGAESGVTPESSSRA